MAPYRTFSNGGSPAWAVAIISAGVLGFVQLAAPKALLRGTEAVVSNFLDYGWQLGRFGPGVSAGISEFCRFHAPEQYE